MCVYIVLLYPTHFYKKYKFAFVRLCSNMCLFVGDHSYVCQDYWILKCSIFIIDNIEDLILCVYIYICLSRLRTQEI